MEISAARKGARGLAMTLAIAAAYFAVAKLGLLLATVTHSVSTVWPPTGLSVALLVTLGPRAGFGVFFGALIANAATADVSIPTAIAIAAGNALEALVAYALLKRSSFDAALERVDDVLKLVAFGALISTIASATIGTASLWISGAVRSDEAARAWIVWWAGDSLSDLIVAPFLLSLASLRRSPWSVKQAVESVIALSILVASSFSPIGMLGGSGGGALPQPYLVFPFLIWAALRLGPRAVAIMNLAVAAMSVAATVMGRGPFVRGSLRENLLLLAVFLAVVAVTALLLGASVAERRRAQRELKEAHFALREADRRKDDFLAMLAHELRNPLAPLVTSAELLRSASADAKRLRISEVIDRQTRHMARLVDDLLDVSRIARGKIQLQPARDDLAAIVRRVVEDMRWSIESAGISIGLEAPSGPVYCVVDATRMAQVVGNLLSNAQKFSERGGSIRVLLVVEGGRARVSVRDKGTGIPAEDLPRIFDPFMQADRTLARSRGGLGLGLTVVKGIVELHGGAVRAASAGAGKGTEMAIEIPLEPGSTEIPR